MGFWRTLLQTLAKNPISFFAVLCVGATAWLLQNLTHRLLRVIESPDWCSKALQAERISTQKEGGLTSCVELLKLQVGGVVDGFLISTFGFVLVLVVLIVVVVAGARANFKVGKDGIEGNVSRDAVAGAEHVADAAKQAEAEVKGA